MNIESYIDHTLLKANASLDDIITLCNEAIQYHFYAVCVNPTHVHFCKQILNETQIKIATVVGFPLGATDTKSKIFEATNAIQNGANEIDMVINIGYLKSKLYSEVENEIAELKKNIGNHILKVIVETCYLTTEEKKIITKIVLNAGADFIKTSTGFGTAGATEEDIILMQNILQNKIKIKASGGIKDTATAIKFIQLGASRIGTSAGVDIILGKTSNSNY